MWAVIAVTYAAKAFVHRTFAATSLARIFAVLSVSGLALLPAHADERQEACKRAMNERIQICTDDCTKTALAAASNYVDTNHNVKFGCLKGCALKQVFQMQACRDGKQSGPPDPTETNQ